MQAGRIETLPTLQQGDRGVAVKLLQKILIEVYGYENVIYNALYQEPTEAAVKEFQQKQGLYVDGVVGPVTWENLAENISCSE
jgi:peptidoglycan hydrolase-like protein with peptidoglycan-binding domain